MKRCIPFKLPDGGRAIVCGSFPRPKPCVVCGVASTALCDYKGPRGMKTCDAPLCEEHRKHVGPDLDVCPLHEKAWARQHGDQQQLEMG